MKENAAPPQHWKEYRRFRAWDLAQQGWKQCEIAVALGVTEGAVSQWLKRARSEGGEVLRHHPAPGPQPKLTPQQRTQLPALLARGAEAFGFRGEMWTTKRVAAVIERAFGVRHHPAHVSRLLRAISLRPQQPTECATQRDQAAIAAWYAERWPAIKKGQSGRPRHRLGRRRNIGDASAWLEREPHDGWDRSAITSKCGAARMTCCLETKPWALRPRVLHPS